MDYSHELELSLKYLRSETALKSLNADPYWPKWNSPWWHMQLLHEMNLSRDIPESVISTYIDSLNKLPLKIFPINPEDLPENVDPYRETPCHCQLGNVYQVLSSRGVDVDEELPWIRPWFLRYQMADGGLNCDNAAYLAKDEIASSMVASISAFEAILLCTHRPWTSQEIDFLKKGADFLMKRKLMEGSPTRHNANERLSAEKWMLLCFPRFYFYDVLRGLTALMTWAEKTKSTIPFDVVEPVVTAIEKRFSDGNLRNERLSFAGNKTLAQDLNGNWQRGQPAILFPLLEKTSKVGDVSPFLSQQWRDTKSRLATYSKRQQL